ncbi:MAG: hypothetical protein M1830_005367 [Pleopsidium flavum]|nr:MAG: hypothetical protein M1830_005367 [Pleopsidium flavum]
MPLRTNTTSKTSFTRPGSVTYDLSARELVTIILPAGSDWNSGLHWHETHVEFLQIIKGRAEVTLNGRTRNYTPDDGIIRVERFGQHEWKRAKPRVSEAFEAGGGLRQESEPMSNWLLGNGRIQRTG